MRTTLLSTMKLRLIASFAMLMMMSTLVYGQLPIDESASLPINCPPGTLGDPAGTTTTFTTSLNATLDCYDEVTLSATVTAGNPSGNVEALSSLQWQVDFGDGFGFVDYGASMSTGLLSQGSSVTITRTLTVVEQTSYQAQILVTHVNVQGGATQVLDLTAVEITGTDFEPTLVALPDVPANTDNGVCFAAYLLPS
ncbi:MAG: hypothetical protein CMN33_05395, partial [Saprospirales bacterium]|nr:hypothetical protein [Saprospirales bacterium]